MNSNLFSPLLFPSPPNTPVIGDQPLAAVALIVVDDTLLMIRRAEKNGDPWSGHMAFPGGRYEPHDQNLRQTAERETWEEVGIKLPSNSFLGPLTPLNHPRMNVNAYVYQLEQVPVLKCNHEVAETFWFTFDELTDERNRQPYAFTYKNKQMSFPSIQTRSAIVWGISYQFLMDLLSRIGR